MVRKSVKRFSEKTVPKQEAGVRSSRFGESLHKQANAITFAE